MKVKVIIPRISSSFGTENNLTMEKAKIGTTKSSEDNKTIVTNQICSFAKLDKNSELSI